jgi:hypothetical protein
MLPTERANALNDAPLHELLTIVLRQFKRPLASHGVELTDAAAEQIAQHIVSQGAPDEAMLSVREAMIQIIAESEGVLARWHLTFAQSLATMMDAIPGWESTAEFLDIANEKSNAEIRIAAGAALVTALGDYRFADYLFQLIAYDPHEPDALIARRVLLFVSGVNGAAPDWLEQARIKFIPGQ